MMFRVMMDVRQESVVMMLVFLGFTEFLWIRQLRKLIEMEHGVVLTVFTEERDVFTEPHVFQVVRDEASVAALDALSEFR